MAKRFYNIREGYILRGTTFLDRLDCGYFSMEHIPSPRKKMKPSILRDQVDPTTITDSMLQEIMEAKEVWEAYEEEYNAKVKEYTEESNKRAAEFREQIEIEHGTSNLPESVRSRIYSLAYEEGAFRWLCGHQ